MKYGKTIIKNICSLIEKDSYTNLEICKLVGITEETFYQWMKRPEFSEAIKKARGVFDMNLVAAAKNSLMKRVSGYEVDETKTVYEPADKTNKESKPKIKEQTITKKHVQPSDVAIIFTLTNKAPDEYQNKQTNKVVLEQPLFPDVPTDDSGK